MHQTHLHRSIPVVCLIVAITACAYGPDIPTMQADPVCHVWTSSGMGGFRVKVPGETASLYAGMGRLEGEWVNSGNFSIDAGMSDVTGSFDGSTMLIETIFGYGKITASIQPPSGHIDGTLGGIDLEANAACEARDMALGAAVITVAFALQN